MPPVSRWSIRLAGLCFFFGLLLWNVSTYLQGTEHRAMGVALHSPSFHLMVVGGLTQIVFGVAWWMFPIKNKDVGRGHPAVAWSAFAFLNTGTFTRVAGGFAMGAGALELSGYLMLIAAICLPLAAIGFAMMIAGRLKIQRSRARKKR